MIEVVVAIFVLGLLLAVGALTFGSTVSRERSKGLAHSLAAELRAARATALQSEKYVAVCIPNDGTDNPFSRSFAVRGGYDRAELIRTVNFEDDLSATIFTGRWTGDAVEDFDELPSWVDQPAKEYRLVFRPDGTALSNDIASFDGRYNFVVASGMEASTQTLQAATNPTTIWVSKAGTVGVLENQLPVGTLPPSSAVPEVAVLTPPSNSNSDIDPEITAVDFLPIKVDELENVGLGQTAVQIHPRQKRPGGGKNGVEYGLTTFRFRAKDLDGGPLNFTVKATANRGEAGNFSYSESNSALGPSTGGQMDYVRDESGNWIWESVISWRPPPGADSGNVYDFEVRVEDPEGNFDEIVSGADLMPRMALLQPENIVYETNDHQLVMTNLDGTSHRRLTEVDQEESKPFYSSDGTRLYSFHNTPETLALITRNADGTQRKALQSFEKSHFRDLAFDPFHSYAAYLLGSTETIDVPYKEVAERTETITVSDGDGGTETISVTVYYLVDRIAELKIDNLEVMHLNSGKKVSISSHAKPDFTWYGSPRFGLSYREAEIHAEENLTDPPAQDPRAVAQGKAVPLPQYYGEPGYFVKRKELVIRDYPPKAVPHDLPDLAEGLIAEVFNLARPRFVLEHSSNDPALRFVDGREGPEQLAPRVLEASPVTSPSWSRDGRDVLYAKTSGDTVQICKRTVLNDKLDGFDLSGEEVLFSDTGASSPLLSASGKYAFFLKDGDILRVEVDSKSAPVNLTENLDRKVLSFVLSP